MRPAAHLSIESMCRLGQVSRAGFYRHWREREPRAEETELRAQIQRIALAHRRNYGYRRITRELGNEGWAVNHKRVARLMAEDNLLCLRKRGFDHHAIAECGDPEVAEEFLPIIHLVFANLKTCINGIHHGVSAKHLQSYLNEFTFRFNRRFYPFNAFRSLLGIGANGESPTYDGLYSGEWTHPNVSHGTRQPLDTAC